MRRGQSPGRRRSSPSSHAPRMSPKDEASKRHDLEKRLAESLETFCPVSMR